MTKTLVLLALLLTSSARGGERLTNDDVIKLTRAGLSPSLIITTINSSAHAFDTSTHALIRLRNEGVANAVLLAMLTTAPGDPSVVRAEFTSVLYRLTTTRSVNGILRAYDDRLTYTPTKESWQEYALRLPWTSVTSMCFEEGPIRGDLFLTVAGREQPIRLSTDPDKIQPLRTRITDLAKRSIPECE